MITLRRTQTRWSARAALAALLSVLLLAAGCNLNDPDVVRDIDASDAASDVATGDAATDGSSDTTATDAEDDTGSPPDADDDVQQDADDTDACQERSASDFCTENGAECGSLTTAGVCEDTRTEICGSCNSSNESCIDNVCTCISPWSGDGIDAAFVYDDQVFVTNLGYIWGYDITSGDWTERQKLSGATTPIDFTQSPAVEGTNLWDADGPTAAVAVDKTTIFFSGSLFWVHDDGRQRWVASGDLNDPAQENFQLNRGLERNIFGDGTIEAGISEDRKIFYLVNGAVFHEFEVQDMSPVEIEQRTNNPEQLKLLFPDQWFSDSQARPWDRGMTWAAHSSERFDAEGIVFLGSENQSWVGPENGPLEYREVAPSSSIYAGAACTP